MEINSWRSIDQSINQSINQSTASSHVLFSTSTMSAQTISRHKHRLLNMADISIPTVHTNTHRKTYSVTSYINCSTHAGGSRCVGTVINNTCDFQYLCMYVHSKMKTTSAINTTFGKHILYNRNSASNDPRSKGQRSCQHMTA